MTRRQPSLYRAAGIAGARALLSAAHPPGGPEVARVRDLLIPADPPVVARSYHPSPGRRLPVLAWVHGGGWCLGDLESSDRMARTLATETGSVVVSVAYRLAPHDPYPAGLDDVQAAIAWLVAHAEEIEADPHRVTAAGESAGANLVVGACLRPAPAARPARQLLVVPVVDLDPRRASIEADPDPRMPVEDLRWFADQYLQEPADPLDARFNPLAAASLAGLPPTIVITAGGDPLRDGGIALVEALRRAGVPTEHADHPQSRHGFLGGGEADARSALTYLSERV